MAQTIGSLDLNAFSDLYNDSTQYFWFESNSSATYGAGVHVTLSPEASFIANPIEQNILMNTDGINLRNELLPRMTLDNDSLDFNMIDTTSNTYTNMATFGLQTRIGRNETGCSRILIDPSSDNVDLINAFEVLTPDNISAFSQKIDTTRTTDEKNFINYSDNAYSLNEVQHINNYYVTDTVSEAFTIDDLNNVTSGETVNIVLNSRLAMHAVQQEVHTYIKFSVDFDIVKGTSSTTNISNVRGAGVVWNYYSPADSTTYTYISQGITHAVSVSYDGNNQVTITSTMTMISTNDSFDYILTNTYISQISYVESTILTPVVFQSGDVVLSQKGLGRTLLGMNEEDMLLENINLLGWDDVLVGVTISPSSTCISNTALYPITTTLTAITVPPHLEVTWTSLSEDLSVTNTGTVSYTGGGGGELDDKHEIQASVSFAGKTYTNTCYVHPFFVG